MSKKGHSPTNTSWSLIKHLRELHQSSSLPVIYGGSAGQIVWFDAGLSDSCEHMLPKPLTRVPALGVLPGFVCPHFDVESVASTAQDKIGRDLWGHTYRGYDFALHLTQDTGNETGLA